MHDREPQLQEDGFHALLPHAAEYIDELLDAIGENKNRDLRGWLLELIGDAKSPKAFPTLIEYFHDENTILQTFAVFGLRKLDTKEARRFLWENLDGTQSISVKQKE